MSREILLLDTDVDTSLRTTVRDLLTARCEPAEVLKAYDGDRSLTSVLWKSVAGELGLAGLLVPQDRGGAGATAREAAVVLEELGRFLAPVPFLESSVIATTVLLTGQSDLVADLAAGRSTAALLLPFSATADADLPTLSRDPDDRLSGRVTSVAGALDADVLLAAVATPDGVEVYAVPASAATVDAVVSLDMTRPLADITLEAVKGDLVVPAHSGTAAVRRGIEVGAALLASEQAGVAAWCLATTVEYLKIRRQFGRVVGGFQAVKHRLADLYVEVESAGAAARYAAATLGMGDADAPAAAAVAASYCSEVAVRAAEEALQLHGGIGMAWEHPVHLYLKRAKADQIGLGRPGHHRSILAAAVDLPAGVR